MAPLPEPIKEATIEQSDVEINIEQEDEEENNPDGHGIILPVSFCERKRNSFSELLQIESDNFIAGVLVGDDDIQCLMSLQNELKKVIGPDNRYQISDSATDGEHLLKMYQDRLELTLKSNWEIKPYSVIITDLHMPGMSGLKAAEEI